MIEVEHLTKLYGAFPALRDVNFNVERGEILGFLGPNGAGKTTTMRIITGYIPPTSGIVRVAGFDVAEKSLQARAHLGYLPETVPLYTELTTAEYLDFKGRISGMHNGRERRARIGDVMDLLNLTNVQNKLIGQLSRGYRQRVGLAQALLHNPDVLILDEPTVGLDPVQITEVRDLIKELGRDHTVILSTHLLPEVSIVCNRVIIINRGRLVALDTPIHMTEESATSQTVQLEVSGAPTEVTGALKAVAGVTSISLVPQDGSAAMPDGVSVYRVEGQPDVALRARLASAVVGGGYGLLEMRSIRPTLEETFINIITQTEMEADEQDVAMLETGMDGDGILEDAGEYAEEEAAVAAPPARRSRPAATSDTTETPTRISAKRRTRK